MRKQSAFYLLRNSKASARGITHDRRAILFTYRPDLIPAGERALEYRLRDSYGCLGIDLEALGRKWNS